MRPIPPDRPSDIGPPPFLGTWPRLYAGLSLWLALVIFALYLFTAAYRP